MKKVILAIALVAIAAVAVPTTAAAGGLTTAQAKQATKKVALKYQAGEGLQVTKLTCKRNSATKVTCKYELRAPELCKSKVVVTKQGSKVKTKADRLLCQVPNADGTMGWQ